MRVGIIALLQESNTFLPARTQLAHFKQDVLLEGKAIRQRFAGGNHEVSGFFAELAHQGVEAVPIFAARALPYGEIAADAWRTLMRMLFDALDRAGACDGYLVAAHGATVSEEEPDADGAWLSELRARVGLDTLIVGTLDPHANLSPRMVAACNALVAYRTNPHVDQLPCGREAASLLVRTLRKEIRPTQEAAFPPVAISIERQDTSAAPCRPLYELADAMLEREGVLSNSVLLGFSYADVVEMGSSMLVVTDDRPALAQQCANELAERLWRDREQFVPNLISVDEALDAAQQLDGPVCLLDMGDNVGGGGPADATWLVHALHRRRVGESAVVLCDPEAVACCEFGGIGTVLRLSVGGHSGSLHGEPFDAEFTVLGLYDGKFTESQPRHGGYSSFDQGRCAVVKTSHGLTLLLTSRRMAPFSLAQLTSCGLDPRQFRVIVAKGVVAPMAAYESVCRHFIRVNTPGVTTADLTQLAYRRRRRLLFPLESNFQWQPQAETRGLGR